MSDGPDAIERSLTFVPLDHFPGRRIAVVGDGGKSTLARALSAKTGLPYIEMDALHWNPGWVESTANELTGTYCEDERGNRQCPVRLDHRWTLLVKNR
jgi:hypothetical protein